MALAFLHCMSTSGLPNRVLEGEWSAKKIQHTHRQPCTAALPSTADGCTHCTRTTLLTLVYHRQPSLAGKHRYGLTDFDPVRLFQWIALHGCLSACLFSCLLTFVQPDQCQSQGVPSTFTSPTLQYRHVPPSNNEFQSTPLLAGSPGKAMYPRSSVVYAGQDLVIYIPSGTLLF